MGLLCVHKETLVAISIKNILLNYEMELTDEQKLELCPEIELRFWWFKKHFKHWQRQKEIMNEIYRRNWINGGFENYHMNRNCEYCSD